VDCWGGFIHRATPDAETTPARPTPILDLVGQLRCPLFAVFGDEDENPSVAQSEELKKRAQAAGKDVTTKVYKNASHAFLADHGTPMVQQISFNVSTLADVQRAFRKVRAAGCENISPVSHGNAWSVYFHDPEGNRIEMFCDTPWYVAQPCGFQIDLDKPEEEL